MTTTNSDRAGRDQLDFERIRILYANMKFGYVGVFSGGLMLYLTAAHFATGRAANYWLLALVVANIPRVLVSVQFDRGLRRETITAANVRPWEARMTWTCTLAYAATTACIFLPYGEHAADAVLVCSLVLMTLGAGAVMVLSTSLPAITIYITMVSLAIIISFFRLPEQIYTWIALVFVLGYLQLLRLVIGQNRMIAENIALKIENSQSALEDPLTGVANRRQLDVVIAKLLPTAERTGDPFSVMMLDLDKFKEYNDACGHSAGDDQLVKVAEALLECSRREDLVVRYGGEEFLVVLPRTNLEDAHAIAERMRSAVKQLSEVTISVGLAQYVPDQDFGDLVLKADDALYRAKNQGRDQVVIEPPAESD